MKIALCQINTTVGDFQGNVAKVVAGLKRASAEGADVAVFPELSTTGYPPRDLLDKPHFIQKNKKAAEAIARATRGTCAAIFGMVAQNLKKEGRPLLNTVVVALNGKITFSQDKTLLPTYDVFDEGRHFEPASAHRVWKYKKIALGLTVCEGIWSHFDFAGRRLYRQDPASILKKKGAKALINISASPYSLEQENVRRKLLSSSARKHKMPIFYCNLVGGNDELIFDGRSLVIDAAGRVVWEGKPFEEDFVLLEYQPGKKPAVLKSHRKTAPLKKMEEVHGALLLGLKDYFRKCGFKKALLGLSGGVDSALVASLAVESLGAENVCGVLMPSRYSSRGSVVDALALARNLGIQTRKISIEPVFSSYLSLLDLEKEESLTTENIQARIRGNILMALSNREGALLLSTGNKSEMSVGYCTLYGDMAGGLAVLADIPKTMVYELCCWLNRQWPMIPESILTKPPSAELKLNQTDQDTLPPYEILDAILRLYIEEHKNVDEIVRKGFSRDVVEDVMVRIDRSEYKRRQAPPGLKITSKAFGIGRRFPIAWKHSI